MRVYEDEESEELIASGKLLTKQFTMDPRASTPNSGSPDKANWNQSVEEMTNVSGVIAATRGATDLTTKKLESPGVDMNQDSPLFSASKKQENLIGDGKVNPYIPSHPSRFAHPASPYETPVKEEVEHSRVSKMREVSVAGEESMRFSKGLG